MILEIKQLSELVIKILQLRQDSVGRCDIEKNQLNHSTHLKHESIEVVNVTIDHLNQLVTNENNNWVDWVKTGLAYNNKITFQLKYDDYQSLPIDFFNNYPIEIFDTNDNQVWLFNEKAITFQQIYRCSSDNIVVIQKNQLMTEYAKDYCQVNDVKMIERF